MRKNNYKPLKQYVKQIKKTNMNKIAFNKGTDILNIFDN